jgi:hypothetical protein
VPAAGRSRATPPRARDDALAGVLLLGLLLAFFWETALGGRVLSAADMVFGTSFFAAHAPAGFTHPANELLFDSVYQFVPWRRFACASLRAGKLPLWNPYSLCGTPFVATMQSAVFHPVNLLLCALPVERGLVWSAVVRLWVAGFSTYLLVRRVYGCGRAAALVSGVSFMLCGFLVVWLGHPHTNVAVWLPALVFLDERLLRATTAGARARAVALLAVVTGVQLTGGHIETSAHVLVFVAAYHAVRAAQLGVRPRLVGAAGALVLGVGLAAVQLVPFLEWLPLSAELARREAGGRPLVDLGFWRELFALPLLVFPNLWGNPTWRLPYRSFLPWSNYNEMVLYVGVVTLLLALVGAIRNRGDAVVRCWTGIGLVALAMALRLPGIDWLNRLPGLRLALPERLRLVACFAGCVLAGFGVGALGTDGAVRTFRRLAAVVVAGGVAMAIGGHAVLPALRGRIVTEARAFAVRKYATLPHPDHPLAHYEAQADEMADAFLRAFRIDDVALYAPALWALLASGLARRRAALGVLVAADLFVFGHGYQPALPAAAFYPGTPITERIATDPSLGRFTALDETLVPDAHMMYGLEDVRGLDFRTRWYDAYLDLVPGRRPWIGYGVLLSSIDSPLLRVLNLRWIAASGSSPPPGVTVVARDGDAILGELTDVQPRGYLVYEAVAAPSDAAAFALLAAAPEVVGSRAVLVGPEELAMTRPAREPAHAVELVRYGAEDARWRVTTAAPAYLVTTDAWYPGWEATIDERPVPIRRANGAFRAVRVATGEHVVRFRYAPGSVRLGLEVTALSGFGVLALLLWATARSRARGAGARGPDPFPPSGEAAAPPPPRT